MTPPWLAALDEDDIQFLKRFLLASGSLKDLAQMYDVSYPTVRSRLDRLIAKAQTADDEKLTDPFERKLKLLVADDRVPPNIAKELLTAHRAVINGRKGS